MPAFPACDSDIPSTDLVPREPMGLIGQQQFPLEWPRGGRTIPLIAFDGSHVMLARWRATAAGRRHARRRRDV